MTQGIEWRTDYEATLAEARGAGRLVAVHFWMEGRPLAREMREATFGDSAVVRALQGQFLSVKVDIASRPELYERLMGGTGGLGTCDVDGTGDVVSVLPGFADAREVVRILERARAGYDGLAERRRLAEGDASREFDLAAAYLALDSPRRAEEILEKIVRRETGPRALAHERLARLKASRGRNLEAREHVAAYRRTGGGREDGIAVTEAMILALELKMEEALRTILEALRRFPSSPERDQMLLTEGFLRHELRQDAPAIAALERLIWEHPDSRCVARARERIEHLRNPPPGHDH